MKRQLDTRYNYLTLWLFDSPTTAPLYVELPMIRHIPKNIATWLFFHDSPKNTYYRLLDYSSAVVTLKNYRDKRVVLDRKTVNLNDYIDQF